MVVGGTVKEYFVTQWTGSLAARLGVKVGEAAGQTAWEFLALLLVLIVWGEGYVEKSLAVLGDNTASLQIAISLRPKESLRAIS